MVDYQCSCGRRVESLEDVPVSRSRPCPCGRIADLALSAPHVRMPFVTVTRGKSDAPPPGALDTRALGDGMPMAEWRKRWRLG